MQLMVTLWGVVVLLLSACALATALHWKRQGEKHRLNALHLLRVAEVFMRRAQQGLEDARRLKSQAAQLVRESNRVELDDYQKLRIMRS